MSNKKNGLLLGWPPFNQFKKEMADLISLQVKEYNKSIKEDISLIKDGVLSLNNRMTGLENRMGTVEKHLNKSCNRN